MIGSNTSGGGFNDLFLFTFYLQKWSILTNIVLQMGWFNQET